MSMQDPIADMLTRIRNAQKAAKKETNIPFSKLKENILSILKDEGYIRGFSMVQEGAFPYLSVQLAYYRSKPVIDKIKRTSRPGLRMYVGKRKLPKILGGLGIAIVSTSKGVMTAAQARSAGLGGEVLCEVV